MIKVVLDTNILVSALWSKSSKPATLVHKALEQVFAVCYDHRIMQEYTDVLNRPKFPFSQADINDLIIGIKSTGLSVIVPEIDIDFIDYDDRKFYEVAKYCDAALITGNTQHFPTEPMIMTVSDFLDLYS